MEGNEVRTRTVECPACGHLLDVPLPNGPEAEEETPDIIGQFCKMTAAAEGAPRRAELEAMKAHHGGIYMFPFNDRLITVYRPVLSGEYEWMTDAVARLVGADGRESDAERELGKQLVFRCCLYPRITPGNVDSVPAGVVPTLANLIHLVSGFYRTSELKEMVMEA